MHTSILKIIARIGLIICVMYFVYQPSVAAAADETTLPNFNQEITNLTITPSIFEGIVTPGQTTKQFFELKNSSDFPLPIKSYIRLFDASDEVGGVTVADQIDTARLSPNNWINVEKPDFVVQPYTSHQITVVFSPPIDLPPGGYYVILFAEPLVPESFLEESSLTIGGRIGSLLFIIGEGKIEEKGKLVSFDISRFIWKKNLLKTSVRFTNEGNSHLKPNGQLTLTNLITRNQKILEVPEFTVLPHKTRQNIVSLSNLKWLGVYQLDLQLQYGKDQTSSNSRVCFYYLPIAQIFVIISIVVFSFFLARGKSRSRILRSIKVLIRSNNFDKKSSDN